jgi:hypothetical protein
VLPSPGDEPGLLFLGKINHRGQVEHRERTRRRQIYAHETGWGLAGVRGAGVNACSTMVTTGCLKQFHIYDITGGYNAPCARRNGLPLAPRRVPSRCGWRVKSVLRLGAPGWRTSRARRVRRLIGGNQGRESRSQSQEIQRKSSRIQRNRLGSRPITDIMLTIN